MSNQHRATPDQWHNLLQYLKLDRIPDHLSITLELAARIETLEAAQQDKLDRLIALDAADPNWEPDPAMTELRAASAGARPAELVERVRRIIGLDPVGDGKARAVIREVAKWLDTKGQHGCSLWLREEADRG
jgi:hypothetical protein